MCARTVSCLTNANKKPSIYNAQRVDPLSLLLKLLRYIHIRHAEIFRHIVLLVAPQTCALNVINVILSQKTRCSSNLSTTLLVDHTIEPVVDIDVCLYRTKVFITDASSVVAVLEILILLLADTPVTSTSSTST